MQFDDLANQILTNGGFTNVDQVSGEAPPQEEDNSSTETPEASGGACAADGSCGCG